MPRKKIYSSDGLEIPYSPLTCNQAEEILKRKPPKADVPKEERDAFYRQWNLDVLRMGLNNAAGCDETTGNTKAWEWTDARILKELDPVVYNEIENAILDMSGLVRRETQPGESKAATSSASS